jgi:hypothetical protein
MYCKDCGHKLDTESKYCSNCGKPVIPKKNNQKINILSNLKITKPQKTGNSIHIKEFKDLFTQSVDTSSPFFKSLSPSMKKVIKGQLHFTDLENFKLDDAGLKEFRYFFNRAVIAGYLTLAIRLEGKLFSKAERESIISKNDLSIEELGELWGKYSEMWHFAYVPPDELIDHFYDIFQKQLYLLDEAGWDYIKKCIYLNIRMGQLMALEEGFPLVRPT